MTSAKAASATATYSQQWVSSHIKDRGWLAKSSTPSPESSVKTVPTLFASSRTERGSLSTSMTEYSLSLTKLCSLSFLPMKPSREKCGLSWLRRLMQSSSEATIKLEKVATFMMRWRTSAVEFQVGSKLTTLKENKCSRLERCGKSYDTSSTRNSWLARLLPPERTQTLRMSELFKATPTQSLTPGKLMVTTFYR